MAKSLLDGRYGPVGSLPFRQSPRLLQARHDCVPADVLKECIDVLRSRRAKVHLVRVLVHVHDQKWHRGRRTGQVIPEPVVLYLGGMNVVSEHEPPGSATESETDPAK